MAKVANSADSPTPRRQRRPALTPEARENQMISLAIDLVEQRLIDGTASSQETTHFLKLATTKARLEKEILERQAELITAKTKALKATEEHGALYEKAIKAMQMYSGHGEDVYED